ncbi:MAG: hypothetical protein QOJ79_1996 [Actinomycetota bacterium]|nr:hypothetical protein [Actinomycetota bacterium]
MTATAVLSRRLVLPAGEVSALCARVGLPPPPGFDAEASGIHTDGLLLGHAVHPSVAAGLRATCSPRVGVLIRSTVGDVAAALGVRADLGGSLVRAGDSDVEVAAWPAERLGAELARVVPSLGRSSMPTMHVPIGALADQPELRAGVIGSLHATVVAPPSVVGQVVWLATRTGWLAVEPLETRAGVRWADVRPAQPDEIGAALAPLIAGALS